jgi:hypothetical protein
MVKDISEVFTYIHVAGAGISKRRLQAFLALRMVVRVGAE